MIIIAQKVDIENAFFLYLSKATGRKISMDREKWQADRLSDPFRVFCAQKGRGVNALSIDIFLADF
ncbi:MAG: hypothetical protein ACO3N7_02880 [Kiritimatiellia bacterium]